MYIVCICSFVNVFVLIYSQTILNFKVKKINKIGLSII